MLEGEKEWDKNVIRVLFEEQDVPDILRNLFFFFFNSGSSDARICAFEKDGQHSVRSAYKIFKEHIVYNSDKHIPDD